VVTGDVLYILVCSIPEGSCGHWGCAIHFSVQHPRRFLWSLGMCCTFWCAASQKFLVVTGDIVPYILVHDIPEGSCVHWGHCAIHFSAQHCRRFLWSLGMCFHIAWYIVFETLVLTFRPVRSLAVCSCMLTVCVLQICVLILQYSGM